MAKRRPTKPTPKRKPSGAVIFVAAVIAAAVVTLLVFASRNSSPVAKPNGDSDGRARQVFYEVVNSYPHDPSAFTQGLLWRDGGFYESTGLYGYSKLRRLEFPSGKVLKEISLPKELFGEGLALVDNQLIQL